MEHQATINRSALLLATPLAIAMVALTFTIGV